MKKLLLIVLALVLVFSMSACGSSTGENDQAKDTTTTYKDTLPIGDGVEDIDISSECYGEYTSVDPVITDLPEGEDVATYYCEDCDTPYIEVISTEKNGRTLEEYTKEQSETYCNGYYIMTDGFGYFTGSWEFEEGFFYCSILTYEGDEQFHTVCFDEKTEEVELGDNVYVYLPTGYKTEKSATDNTILMGSYDDCYAFPNFRLSKDDDSYESSLSNFTYNGENNFTKEQYEKWSENWTEEDNEEFFAAVGYKIITTFNIETEAGEAEAYILENQRDEEETFCGVAYVDSFRLNLWCDEGMPAYPFLNVLIKSVHTK